jgi:hypothetical protein
MKAKVEIELTIPAEKKHIETMRSAAESLTIDKKSITVIRSPKNPKLIIAEFAIKKAPQYKVVDRIGDEFGDSMDDYNDCTISFSDDEPEEKSPKGKSQKGRKAAIPDEMKKQVAEIVEKFNRKTFKGSDVFYIPRYKGKYLFLDRSEHGTVGQICRLEFLGDIESWEFAIFKYSDERYEADEFFPGMEHLDGTIIGAMKAGLEAYPVS